MVVRHYGLRLMSYSFVSKLSCSVKEKQQIQLDYWFEIIRNSLRKQTNKGDKLPAYLIEVQRKYFNA
jgi:hypothetical protein